MKNTQFILLVVMGLAGCKIQQVVVLEATPNNGMEEGDCHFSILQNKDIKGKKPFVLEIIPPQFEEIEVTYSETELEKFNIGDGHYQFRTREPYFKFIIKETDLSEFTTIKNPTGYMYCMVGVASPFLTLTKDELLSRNNKVVLTRVISHSKIRKKYVEKKPTKLKENQYYFEGGNWTEPKKAIGKEYGGISILDVKKKLIELGYNLVKNDIIDQDTKDALLDFQRKNELKEGQLDRETLEKLGVKSVKY